MVKIELNRTILASQNVNATLNLKIGVYMSVFVDKSCVCGTYFKDLPDVHEAAHGLYWWNCGCNSTLTHPIDSLTWRRHAKEAREFVEKLNLSRKIDNERLLKQTGKTPLAVEPRLKIIKD